jgi:DNA-directed RNA polymerase subunit RPC12/RpoP
VLALEPTHPEARRGLAILDGRLDPASVIDPNRPPAAPAASPQPAQARRFVCQKCGGKLAFSADGQELSCAYCNKRMTLYQAIESGAMAEEQDFAVALATAKGHSHPVTTQSLSCQACGAAFMLGPQVLSLTCPYCRSAYVVEVAESRELIPPDGIIPFAVSRDAVVEILDGWLRANDLHQKAKTEQPGGLYVPAWTFDVGGEAQWRGHVLEKSYGGIGQTARTGSYPVFYDDVMVPASHTLPAEMTREMYTYQLTALVPYHAGYLADWPAEIYQVSVADASLVARRLAWEQARQMVTTRASVELGYVRDLTVSSAAMVIETFKLILLPVWIVRYRVENKDHIALINGQTGSVRGDQTGGGFIHWLAHLF